MTDTLLKPLADLLVASKDGDWGSDDEKSDHSPMHVIRGADFPAARLRQVDQVPLRYLPDRTSARRTLQANDILLETAGGTRERPTGRTLLVTQELLDQFEWPVTCASFSRFLRADPEVVDPRYLFWYLQFVYATGETFQYQVQHTGVARFQYTTFARSRLIPLPPLRDQRAIVEVLGALDDKIAANAKLAGTADELAGAKTRESLDDVRSPILADIARITMGSSPPGSSYNELGVGIVFYQGVRDFGMRYPTNRVWTTAPVRTAEPGDCLVSVRAPVGEVNVSMEPICLGRGLASVRSTSGAPATLFHLLKALPDVWAPFEAGGTVFGSINKKQLEELRIPSIRRDRVEGLELELASLEGSIRTSLNENLTLAATRDALLPHLMSGKLRVKDVEKIVSDRT